MASSTSECGYWLGHFGDIELTDPTAQVDPGSDHYLSVKAAGIIGVMASRGHSKDYKGVMAVARDVAYQLVHRDHILDDQDVRTVVGKALHEEWRRTYLGPRTEMMSLDDYIAFLEAFAEKDALAASRCMLKVNRASLRAAASQGTPLLAAKEDVRLIPSYDDRVRAGVVIGTGKVSVMSVLPELSAGNAGFNVPYDLLADPADRAPHTLPVGPDIDIVLSNVTNVPLRCLVQ